MKKKGNICLFREERLADLRRVVGRLMMEARHIDTTEIFTRAVKEPARRFYVSEERAAQVVGMMKRGEPLTGMTECKQRMFEEIYRRVEAERERHPEKSLLQRCGHVVNMRAPEFYLTPLSAREYLYRDNRARKSRTNRRERCK